MKIYISVDMEGIGCVCLPEQTIKGTALYEEARHLMIEEVNAAVEAAYECGADTIIVRDYHGSEFNFPITKLIDKARYIMGGGHKPLRYPFLDDTFDGMILLGYHAMAGTKCAVLEHTWAPDSIYSCSLNGKEIGELAMDGLIAGSYGVPVILVTGDDKICLEAAATFGDVCTAEVKKGLGRQAALFMDPASCRNLIRESVKNAIARIKCFKPYTMPGPYEVRVVYKDTASLDYKNTDGITVERLDARTLAYRSCDIKELFANVF